MGALAWSFLYLVLLFWCLFLGAPAFERCAFTTSPFCGNSCLGVSGGGGGWQGILRPM